MEWLGYLIGGALVVYALFRSRTSSRNSLRGRDVSGNNIVGNVSGSVSQGAPPPSSPKPTDPASEAAGRGDPVAWVLAGIGILVMVAQLVVAMRQ